MKTKKNILFICYDYPPILSPEAIQVQRRAISLAKIYNIHILTTHLNPLYEFIDNKLIKSDNLKIHRTKKIFGEKFFHIFFKFLNIGDRKLWWSFFNIKRAKKLLFENDIFLIYTHSTPLTNHFLGLYLKNKFPTLKWIAHFSDPWTLNPYISYPTKFHFKFNRYFEDKILKEADKITVTSEKTKQLFLGKFNFLKRKIFVLPHTFDPNLYELNNKNNNKNKNKKIVLHTGNIYGLRTMKYLLFAINELKHVLHNKIEFHFYGKVKNEEVDIVENLQLKNLIKIMSPVPYHESIKLMSKADFLLVIDAPIKDSPFFPSKLADYIGARKPIMALTPQNSATIDILNHINNNKFISESDNISKIKKILIKILNFKEKFSFNNIEYYDMNNLQLLEEVFNV